MLSRALRPDAAVDRVLGVGDWVRVRPVAESHGLLPHLAAHARAHPERWDPAVLRDLTQEHMAQLRWNLAAVAQAAEIVAVLDAANVPSLVLKGPGLSVAAYGGLANRTFSDLDVLIVPSDIRAAIAALHGVGYRPAREATELLPRTNYQVTLLPEASRLPIELHWQSALRHYAVRPHSTKLLARRQFSPVAGKLLPTLSPADQVLYLATHGAVHEWRRLEWLLSFAGVVNRNPQAMPLAVDEARRVGLRRVLELGLVLSSRFGLLSPEAHAWLGAEDLDLQALASHVVRRIGMPFVPPGDEASGISWFWIRSRERGIDRAAVLASFALRPTERDEIVRLPAHLGFAYYLIRPFRLAWSRIGRLGASFRHR